MNNKKLAEEYKILITIVRNSLLNNGLDENMLSSFSNHNWQVMIGLAQQHNIIPLLCDGLKQFRDNIPNRVFAQIAGLTIVSEDAYNHSVVIVKELASIFSKHHIPFMIIKGYGLSLYYPNPCHRLFSDIDTYNFGCFERADQVLAQEVGAKIDTTVHHHTTTIYKGILVENHYDFINTTQHKSNIKFERILKAVAEKETVKHDIDGVTILLPSAMFNALFLMRHMAAHYAAERVSIRHLCDWMQFIRAEYKNIDWQRVNGIYEEFNMKRFADAITRICITHLGMKDGLIPDVHCDEKLEERILNDILFAEFSDEKPNGFLRIVWWKIRRYYSNRWKHKLIYNESWVWTFFQASWAHLIKPKTITH